MPLAEGMEAVIYIKPYVSGLIDDEVEDLAPGASGAVTLRRVSSSLNLKKATYTSAEIRSDRQIADFRHGARHVDGDIAGEFSGATYFDLFEAVHRDIATPGISASQTDFTSMSASASASTITFTTGDPVALGYQVGHVFRMTGSTAGANNGKNFTITSFSGLNNATVHVTPAPVDSTASVTFTVTGPGQSTKVPLTGFVQRKFGIEIHNQDLDFSRLFTETRASKYALSLPATGMSTAVVSFYGRNMVPLTGAAAPYFTSPLPVTKTGIYAAVNGTIMRNGFKIGVVTGVTIQCDLSPSGADVVGQNVTAEVFLGRANVTGQITAYLKSGLLVQDFLDESELELLLRLDATSAANTPSTSIYLPRIKFGGSDIAVAGEAGQMITMPYQALLYEGTAPGRPNTTIQIYDTEA